MKKPIDFHTHQVASESTSIFICEFDKLEIPEHPHYFCLGIHPWFIPDIDWNIFEETVKSHHRKENFFALGEMGLDKIKGPELEVQKAILIKQIQLANSLEIKRIVLHNVKTYSDCLEILIQEKFSGTIVLHDYRKNRDLFNQYQKHFKTYISIGEDFVKHVSPEDYPLSSVLLETDDKSTSIRELYKKAAIAYQITEEDLIEQMHQNLQNILLS